MYKKSSIKDSLIKKSKSFFSSKFLILFILILTIVLTLPSIFTGLQLDDYMQYNRFLGITKVPENSLLWGLFSFGNNDSSINYMNLGAPWWSDTELKINLFRPLSEISHWIDYKLWPHSPVMMHIHSLIWYLLVILAVFWLFKRIDKSVWIVGFAILIFAVDHSHGKTLSWISNRNAVIATLFGVLSIIFFDIWRKDKKFLFLFPSLFFYIFALLSGEIAVSAVIFIFSYCIFLDEDKIYKRILSFLPYFIITASWILMYKLLGYGAAGSGAYVSPFDSPLLFIKKILTRLPILFFGYWSEPPIDILSYSPGFIMGIMYVWIVLIIAAVIVVLIPLLKRDKIVRFWFLCFLLSLLPITSTVYSTRLLFFSSIAGACLLSYLIFSYFKRAHYYLNKKEKVKIYIRIIMYVLIFFNIFISAVSKPIASISYYLNFNPLKNAVTNLPENNYKDKNIVLVNPPFAFFSIYFVPIRAAEKLPLSKNLWTLSSGLYPVKVERINNNTIDITPEGGFYKNEVDQIVRNPEKIMNVGDEVELNGMIVEIMSLTKDLRPLRVRFKFRKSLDDPNLVFLKWDKGLFKNYSPPEINGAHSLRIY